MGACNAVPAERRVSHVKLAERLVCPLQYWCGRSGWDHSAGDNTYMHMKRIKGLLGGVVPDGYGYLNEWWETAPANMQASKKADFQFQAPSWVELPREMVWLMICFVAQQHVPPRFRKERQDRVYDS